MIINNVFLSDQMSSDTICRLMRIFVLFIYICTCGVRGAVQEMNKKERNVSPIAPSVDWNSMEGSPGVSHYMKGRCQGSTRQYSWFLDRLEKELGEQKGMVPNTKELWIQFIICLFLLI